MKVATVIINLVSLLVGWLVNLIDLVGELLLYSGWYMQFLEHQSLCKFELAHGIDICYENG